MKLTTKIVGQSHAQFYRDVSAPETKEAFEEIARFFDKHAEGSTAARVINGSATRRLDVDGHLR